jgi:hypothetical protein
LASLLVPTVRPRLRRLHRSLGHVRERNRALWGCPAMYARADPLGSLPLVAVAVSDRNINKPVAAAALAAAPLRGELENRVAAFPPAAEDA